jgi:acyl-coenzyme A thioesterase PaaI-like protein
MGQVLRKYCDACGSEVERIEYDLVLTELATVPAHTHRSELCGGCYSKLRDYFGGLALTAAGKWEPVEPEPVKVEPTIEDEPKE